MSTITEAIILAGGLGTRLRSAVPDLPKCMAPVAGKPFLVHVMDYFRKQGIERFIFSLGYKHEDIVNFVEAEYPGMDRFYVVEETPLGTGGGIRLACQQANTRNLLVLNGDTIFKIDLKELAAVHSSHQAHCTLSLKPMKDFDRYGVVEINKDQQVTAFHEKKHYEEGLINGGVYALNVSEFLAASDEGRFSFEKDYLEVQTGSGKLYGYQCDGYFIDIGIPEDFEKAQQELSE